ncbi:CBO0543 family protein [Bacillus carboniphilus]|uniref:CBO0543 family protein n=1 Tax=Bacillus carboniphilus TaxID=86663 RepID=A0ABY9JSH9_9BACI|nr:CBO0543 family protein [Bacillus carboniphilus]WLR41208.1 CBO0543 family protein [Bacillus carboniphilus]
MNKRTIEEYNKIYVQNQETIKSYVDYWKENVLFQWEWWLLVAFLVVPWLLFLRYKNKERLPEILIFGLLWINTSILLDGLGYNFGAWGYPVQIIPYLQKALPYDLAIIPVTFMFMYQLFPKGLAFYVANLICSFGASYIAEPLSEWVHLYEINDWEYIYSFIIYFILNTLFRLLTLKITTFHRE